MKLVTCFCWCFWQHVEMLTHVWDHLLHQTLPLWSSAWVWSDQWHHVYPGPRSPGPGNITRLSPYHQCYHCIVPITCGNVWQTSCCNLARSQANTCHSLLRTGHSDDSGVPVCVVSGVACVTGAHSGCCVVLYISCNNISTDISKNISKLSQITVGEGIW